MTRDQVCDALDFFVKLHRGVGPTTDVLADLTALAFPTQPTYPTDGFGDDLNTLHGPLRDLLSGWDFLAAKNEPWAEHYREGARAVRHCIRLAEASA